MLLKITYQTLAINAVALLSIATWFRAGSAIWQQITVVTVADTGRGGAHLLAEYLKHNTLVYNLEF